MLMILLKLAWRQEYKVLYKLMEGIVCKYTAETTNKQTLYYPSCLFTNIYYMVLQGEQLWADKPVSEVVSTLLQLFIDGVSCAYDRLIDDLSKEGQSNLEVHYHPVVKYLCNTVKCNQ